MSFSIELIVCRDPPIAAASCPWASPRWVRNSRTWFFTVAGQLSRPDHYGGAGSAGDSCQARSPR